MDKWFFTTWWTSLQPSWCGAWHGRTGAAPALLLGSEWGKLAVFGQNGLLSMVAMLYWWGFAEKKKGVAASSDGWEEVALDILNVLQGLEECILALYYSYGSEHLGEGQYQLLLPDPRSTDLVRLVGMVDSYRMFLYEFQPLQNTDRLFRRHTVNTNHPHATLGSSRHLASAVTNSGGPSTRPSQNSGFASPPPHTCPHVDELGISLADFDLDEEPAPLLSQQASSSQGPPLRPVPLSVPPFLSGASACPGFNNPPTAFPTDVEMEPVPPIPQQQPGVHLRRCHARRPNLATHLLTLTMEQRAQYVVHFTSVLKIASQDVEMLPVDRKGKGKAKE
ncbi:hypothetical protein B0H13DRAFT_2347995 [Mycena leptocephala]|nr:hypothetical protein B0H13DRAFT_2347995 [Mycena leptocephala]